MAAAQATLILQPGPAIQTVAGTGIDARTVPGKAVAASLGSPGGLVYDAAGDLYVADSRNHQVDRIGVDGTLTVVAGSGSQGFAGDGGLATAAELNSPMGVALDSSGRVVIADTGNHRIRRIAADGTIATIAGNGQAAFSGDGGLATIAALRRPAGVLVGSAGDVYIADTGNHRVRHLLADGTIQAIAGNGFEGDSGDGGPAVAASLEAPTGLVLMPDGRLLIVDRSARRLRAVDGAGNIAAYSAGGGVLRRPDGVAMDAAGNLYLADSVAQSVTEIASTGTGAFAGNGTQGRLRAGAPTASPLDTPVAVATSPVDGSVAVSDRRNHQVQRISLPLLAFGGVPAGKASAGQALVLQNGGSAPLQVTGLVMPAGFVTSGTTCAAVPFSLAPSGSCTVTIAFAPAAQGAQSGTAQVMVAGGVPGAVLLSGTGTAASGLAGSSTELTANGTVSYAGAPVVLTATVTGGLPGTPTGNVTFFDGTSGVATMPLASGVATLTTTSMAVGQHSLHASYAGDAAYAASDSGSVSDTVVPTPDFTFSAAGSSYAGKASGSVSINFTALPLNGTLGQPLTLAVSGLPRGSTSSFLPAALTLGGSGATTVLTIQFPATLSRSDGPVAPMVAMASVVGIGMWVGFRKRWLLPVLALAGLLFVSGCGGGFRVVNTAGTGTGGNYNYTAVVTATTTGVLGETLVHSASVALTVSQ